MFINDLTVAEDDTITKEFEYLLLLKGKITTLEVKNVLRSKGYWVDQRDVSRCLADYVSLNTDKYSFSIENHHRVYSLVDQSPDSNQPVVPNSVTPPIPYNKGSSGTYSAPTVGWCVTGSFANMVLPTETYPDLTRNKARYAYAKKYKILYTDTSAKRSY